MSWLEPRRVKILLLRPQRSLDDRSVTFLLTEEKSAEFQEVLSSFLEFCASNEGRVTTETIDDADTHAPYWLIVRVAGNQALYARELGARFLKQLQAVAQVI